MTAIETPVETLEKLIEGGAFTTRLEEYLDSNFRHGTRETFYSKTLAESGYDAAERQLTQWVSNVRYDTFSAVVDPIARGILALAKANPEILTDITHCETRGYGVIDERFGPRHKFIAYNTQVPGCGCSQPKGSEVFGPYGALSLKAVILETGYGYDGSRTNLQFVLPAWGKAHNPPNKGEFVLAKIHVTGSSYSDKYSPFIRTEEDSKDFDDVDATLRHLLGIQPNDYIGIMMECGGMDETLGFPGAEEYLAAKLADLGDYFVALTEKLSTTHAH